MTFKEAVEAAPAPVNGAWRAGLWALEARDRQKVSCNDPRLLTGSVYLDEALMAQPEHARANRWDYGLGYKPTSLAGEWAVWVEVHPATTREVSTVLKKLQWLKDWLNGEAGALRDLTDRTPEARRFVWIASNGVNIRSNTPQARRLRQKNLWPRSNLSLP